MLDLRDYKITGQASWDDAMAAALADAVAAGLPSQLLGGHIRAPLDAAIGPYEFARRIDVYGHVTIEGEGRGDANGGTRFTFVTPRDGGLVLHTQSSHPSGVNGGSRLRGLDLYGARSAIPQWAANTQYACGAVVRPPGDNRFYLECVVAGTSGALPPVAGDRWVGSGPLSHIIPAYDREWTPGERTPYHAVRRPVGGTGEWLLTNLSDGRRCGASEPAWTLSPGAETLDQGPDLPLHWQADHSTCYPADGTARWAVRTHSGVVVLCAGTVEDVSAYRWDCAGILIYGSAGGAPVTNANGAHIARTRVAGCGAGYATSGPDANSIMLLRVEASTIGYEANGTTRIGDGSGGVGFDEHGFLGNTWIGAQIETATGRAVWSPVATNRSVWVSGYAESAAPSRVHPGQLMVGGQWWAGSGFEPGWSGMQLSADHGCFGLSVAADPAMRDNPTGFVSVPGLGGGLWAHTDAHQLGRLWAHRKGDAYDAPYPWLWTRSLGKDHIVDGYSGFDGPDGPARYEPRGHYMGVSSSGGRYLEGVAQDVQDRRVRGGRRVVGDAFRGAYTVGGVLYLERVCTVAGYDASAWAPNGAYQTAGLDAQGYTTRVYPAGMVQPTTPNGYVYQCVQDGATAASPPTWPTQVGADVADGTVVWRCVGPVAQYGYGRRVETP